VIDHDAVAIDADQRRRSDRVELDDAGGFHDANLGSGCAS
jgi:hypothetical protein